MKFLIVKNSSGRVTKRINVEYISSINATRDAVVICYGTEYYTTLSVENGTPEDYADWILDKIVNGSESIIDIRPGANNPFQHIKE